MHMNTTPTVKRIALALALAAASAAPLFSLELGAEGWLGNLGFSPQRAIDDAAFPGASYYWGLSVWGSQELTNAISFETGFAMDQILRNVCYTLFDYHADFLTVGFGPFFGLFNDWGTLLKSGISTSVRIEVPGIAFASFRSDSSIGGELVQDGDYFQTRNDISFGVHIPNAICTLSLNTREFEQKAAGYNVVDSLTEYVFSTDIYKKNVPYRLIITVGYQNLSRSFIDAASTATTATLDSVILGTEVDVSFSQALLLKAGVSGNVYSFGQGTLVGACDTFLFRTFLGMRMNVDSFPVLSQIL
jgi:hypothetical protein